MAAQTVHPPTPFDSAVRTRLRALLEENYIHTPRNAELWCLLEDLMFQVCPESPKPKVMGCLLTGEPHSGKTTAVRQFKKAYLENVPEADPNDVFVFQIPGRARLKGVMTKMATQLKIPDVPPAPRRDFPTYLLVEKVAAKLARNGVKLVIIDEFQNLFQLPGESRVEILSGFNDLVNESHVPIVLVGVVGADRLLDIDYYKDESNLKGTFCSRFAEFPLGAWDDPHDAAFAVLLKTVHDDCRLNPPSGSEPFFADDAVREWIADATGGLTGKVIALIKWAARQVIRSGLPEVITIEVLERALRTLQAKGW